MLWEQVLAVTNPKLQVLTSFPKVGLWAVVNSLELVLSVLLVGLMALTLVLLELVYSLLF